MSEPLPTHVRSSWTRFLEAYEPLRPDLYRYCRYLARSPWDAEDLVQDALARAFVTLGCAAAEPSNPRAWLFRVASNLWFNRRRQARLELGTPRSDEPSTTPEPRASREAAGTLLAQLSPQERAAVVLKDVFELSLGEIAEALSTTEGAVKAALHRGRGKLAEPDESAERTVERHVLDALCTAFNARDLDRVTALLLDTAVVEYPGIVVEYGPAAAREGTLHGALFGCSDPEVLAASPPHLLLVRTIAPRAEVRVHRGEPILLCWWHADGRETVRAIMRADTDGDRIAHLRTYLHSPELLEEVGRELGVPVTTSGYRA